MTMCAGFALTAAAQQDGRIKIAGLRNENCQVYVKVTFQENDCSGAGMATVCIALPTDGTSSEIQTPNPAYLFLRSIEAFCGNTCSLPANLYWTCPDGTSNTGLCCSEELIIKGTVEHGFNIVAP